MSGAGTKVPAPFRIYCTVRYSDSMTQTHDIKFDHTTDPEWMERSAAMDRRFVEIVPTMTIYGPEFEGLEFDDCSCSQCETPVAGYIASGDGNDYGTWTDVWMDADWELWCEDCAWEVSCEEVIQARYRTALTIELTTPNFKVATDRAEDEPCQAGTPGCCVDHKGGENCETW